MNPTSFIEISRSALNSNLQFLRNLLAGSTRLSSVVKGNAYGHGIEHFVPLAEEGGIDHFSVFSADEALRVSKKKKGSTDLMIMGQIDNSELEWAIVNDVSFYVFELDRLEAALLIAKKLKTPAKVHLEVETGMFRTGLEPLEVHDAIELLQRNPEHLRPEGLCTHFAGAESIANYYRIKKQWIAFRQIRKKMTASGLPISSTHAACSAAALRYPDTHLDLARIGILQYGFFPNRETMVEYITKKKDPTDPLKRLLSWKSKVMDIKSVPAGSFIGYGTSYLANQDMQVAAIPVGYSHGYSRGLSNQGRVLINGQRTAVLGMVNMNMMMVDVTPLEHVRKGDEVVLIGRQGDLEISVSAFGDFSHLVNYEILTRLPSNIPRLIVE